MDDATQAQNAQAGEILDDIAALKRGPAFERYFLREPREKIAEIERKLRDRSLSEADRQFQLGRLEVFERWRDKLAADAAANASILNS